jgi:hypothetical protein
MSAPPPKRPLGAEQRRALQFLAGIPFGATEAALSLNGFQRQMSQRLLRAGLITTEHETKAGGQSIGRIRITEAGRLALESYRTQAGVRLHRNAAAPAGVGLLRGMQRAMLSRFAILRASAYVLFITGNCQRASVAERPVVLPPEHRNGSNTCRPRQQVYKIAKKAVWLGTVEAPDKQAAVQKAAQESKTEVWRLYAVARR